MACIVSVAIVHCSLFTLNMRSAWYLQLSGIIYDRTSFCVVAFSITAACATLIPHFLLKYSSVMFVCCYADKKALSCLVSVGFFGGSATISMVMSFTSCSITSLATCPCCSLVALYIDVACLPDIRTLATSFWLKRCVFNMISSSSSI